MSIPAKKDRSVRFRTRDAQETMALAGLLSQRAPAPGLILLEGALGSGKTTFVRGFLRGLGFKGDVPSPTFTLINEYGRTRPPVFHMDLYRVEPGELENLGLEEYLGHPEAVSLVEWPAVLEPLYPVDRLEAYFRHAPGGRREIRLRGWGKESRRWLESVA